MLHLKKNNPPPPHTRQSRRCSKFHWVFSMLFFSSFLRQNPAPSSSGKGSTVTTGWIHMLVSLVAKGQCLGIRVAQMIKALHSSIPGKQKTAVSQPRPFFVLRRCLDERKRKEPLSKPNYLNFIQLSTLAQNKSYIHPHLDAGNDSWKLMCL